MAQAEVIEFKSPEKWALVISDTYQKSRTQIVDSILRVGMVLCEAKAALKHGEWCRLFDERMVPMSLTEVMIMSI